jgi:sec-independent protein translocase protein TatA
MGSFSIWHLLIFLAIILLIFAGGGRIPKLMSELGRGATAFRKGLNHDSDSVEGRTGIVETKKTENKDNVNG